MNKTIAICGMCGKEFSTFKSEIRRCKGKYCSLSCAAKVHFREYYKNHNVEGEANHHWKGGWSLSPINARNVQLDRYPDHMNARRLVKNAIKTGQLIRKPCEVCGKEQTEAHHDDYSNPLDVRWLCKEHHLLIGRNVTAFSQDRA